MADIMEYSGINHRQRYLRKLINIIIEAALLVVATIFSYIVLLIFLKSLWALFSSTHMGQKYAEQFSYSYRMTQDFFHRDMIHLIIKVVLSSFIICLIVSAFCRIFHISRYIYYSGGIFRKIIIFGLPLTYVVAVYIKKAFEFQQMDIAYSVALIPTLCMFMSCFRYSKDLLPEVGYLTHGRERTNQEKT